MEKLIYFFYIFFQGLLFLQAAIFIILYKTSGKKELLYYSLFLLLIAMNFLISDPSTFGFGEDEPVLNSTWYKLVNTPLVITANIFYVLFLREFYKTLTRNRLFFSILRYTGYSLFAALSLFLFLFAIGIHSNLLFNIINLLGSVVGIWLVTLIIRERMPYTKLMAYGFIINLAGTLITVFMLILLTQGVKHLLVSEYPLIFIKLGLLAEIFFFNLAIFKKWNYQEKELALHQFKTMAEVERVRNEISRELHDDIGATLSGIHLYSHMAMAQTEKGDLPSLHHSVETIQQSAADMVSKLKDIVWVNNNSDKEGFTERLKDYVVMMAQPAGITPHFDFSAAVEFNQFPADIRYQLYLICKEAVNNAVKHSGAKNIIISFNENKEGLLVEINDDGNGFDTSATNGGNGMGNMQKRAEALGGQMQVSSAAGSGTSIRLYIKIPLQGIGIHK